MQSGSSDYVALVPLRGGSKSIPRKNIQTLGGYPLCYWTLRAAAQCTNITSVFVSTDDDEICGVVEGLGLGIRILMRPDELATDTASTESVMMHFADEVDFGQLVTIQATSPLLTASHLSAAISQFEREKLDSMLSAVRTKRFFWDDQAQPMNYDPKNRPRRQDFPGTLMENGAFYITTREILYKDRCRLGGSIGVFEMPESTAIEIDEPDDWRRVEEQLNGQKK